MKHVMIAVVILSGLAVSPCAVAAQPWSPPPRMNLKVLPESTDDRTLIATMRRFAQGLGVRCQHCHIYKGDNPDDLSTYLYPTGTVSIDPYLWTLPFVP